MILTAFRGPTNDLKQWIHLDISTSREGDLLLREYIRSLYNHNSFLRRNLSSLNFHICSYFCSRKELSGNHRIFILQKSKHLNLIYFNCSADSYKLHKQGHIPCCRNSCDTVFKTPLILYLHLFIDNSDNKEFVWNWVFL